MNKYCRICWNTLNWRRPSGEARRLETGESYVSEHGFGHEEWLFNFEWLLSGYNSNDLSAYKYGFLQPIGKYRDIYVGDIISVLLYTVNPDRTTLIVARIDNLFVPGDRELSWALSEAQKNGWLDTMRQQVSSIGGDVSQLLSPNPSTIANVRFKPENVISYDPMVLVTPPHKTLSIYRYHPLYWDDGYNPISSPPDRVITTEQPEDEDRPDRAETERKRAAQTGTIYDPQHARLQNRLRRKLRSQYGAESVEMENEFVDLKLIESNRVTFIEIKMERTVKSCIRSALGQLLEYSHYPDQQKADALLIIGDACATENDRTYLSHIRMTFNLPIYYAQWSWTDEELGPWI